MFKKIPIIITKTFLLIAIIQLLCIILLVFAPQTALAADDVKFAPQISVGDFQAGVGVSAKSNPKLLGEYIAAIYKWGTGVVAILAAVVLMFGGVSWIFAMGNAERIGNAKAWIGAALTGLILAMCSYLILQIINPELLKINKIEIPEIAATGCCTYLGVQGTTCDNISAERCAKIFHGKHSPDSKCITQGKKKICKPNVCCIGLKNNTQWGYCQEVPADSCNTKLFDSYYNAGPGKCVEATCGNGSPGCWRCE